MKDSFLEELDRVFDKFPKKCKKNLFGDLNAEVGKEDIFKPTTGSEGLEKITNNNGYPVINFATYKNLSEVNIPTL
jgi:hypothetical protein